MTFADPQEPLPPRRRRRRRAAAWEDGTSADGDAEVLDSEARPDGQDVSADLVNDTTWQAEGDDSNGVSEAVALPSEIFEHARAQQQAHQADIINRLSEYADRAQPRSSVVAEALRAYASRVRDVAAGNVPPTAAELHGLTPALVADTTATSQWVGPLEALRNVLIFLPVLWTWFEVSRAATAYDRFIQEHPGQAGSSFIQLWQDKFGSTDPLTLSLSGTAMGAIVLVGLLVVVSGIVTTARAGLERRKQTDASEFAALISRASSVRPAVTAETPAEQLQGFVDAGRDLVAGLEGVALGLETASRPLAQSVSAANQALAETRALLESQSEQLRRQSEELRAIVPSLQQTAAMAPALLRAADALADINDAMTPSAQQLVTTVDRLGDYSVKLTQATDNFVQALAQLPDGVEAFNTAAKSMNTVANRILDSMEPPR